MEPIPETHEVLEELERYGDVRLRASMERCTSLAKQRVPGLVGVSLGLLTEGIVLTYLASDVGTAALDAVQYVDDGPCLEAIHQEDVVETDTQALLDEGTWRLFAQASAAVGVRSSLSMPVRRNGVVKGGVNLYGDASDTFEGHVQELAMLFGAWAPGAVANADLSFATRLEAVASPRRLKGQAYIDTAIGILVAHGLDPQSAEEKLRTAAARAGVAVLVLARALVESREPPA
jgi:GAF domain-containing protein